MRLRWQFRAISDSSIPIAPANQKLSNQKVSIKLKTGLKATKVEKSFIFSNEKPNVAKVRHRNETFDDFSQRLIDPAFTNRYLEYIYLFQLTI